MQASLRIPNEVSESFAGQLLTELESAYQDVRSYIAELAQLLDQPQADRLRLTSVRLRLAQLRLTHGAAVGHAYRILATNADGAEQSEIKEMQLSHQRLLQAAAAHTGKWTFDAVEADWAGYRQATRTIVRCWLAKMESERQLLYPLLERKAHLTQVSRLSVPLPN